MKALPSSVYVDVAVESCPYFEVNNIASKSIPPLEGELPSVFPAPRWTQMSANVTASQRRRRAPTFVHTWKRYKLNTVFIARTL